MPHPANAGADPSAAPIAPRTLGAPLPLRIRGPDPNQSKTNTWEGAEGASL